MADTRLMPSSYLIALRYLTRGLFVLCRPTPAGIEVNWLRFQTARHPAAVHPNALIRERFIVGAAIALVRAADAK